MTLLVSFARKADYKNEIREQSFGCSRWIHICYFAFFITTVEYAPLYVFLPDFTKAHTL